ncbi:MAG: DUF134 domain-containing protein [Acidobacteria bacterium]|nr:DUF134 domain-containing protein [Acidobacteriota bacterium]MBU4405076.1 DUF134 domain-containing protein [Acidobacteriota bacterium]MCG2811674.1 DUF134 domain-containing protein [Candidatus Aminicenantes bacterium]
MPRCKKHRCCRFLESDKIFKPRSLPLQGISLTEIFLDEFEAVRLCDHDRLSQIEAAEKMSISRGTVQRLLESGRFKIIEALLHDKAIKINRQ